MKTQFADIPNLMDPLRRVKAAFPKLGRMVDEYRAKNKHRWPESFFIPIEFWRQFPLDGDSMDVVDAMCRWQIGKGIYLIDPDIYEALVETPTGEVPVEVFEHLPEWCVFIPTPSMESPGFWAYLTWSVQFGRSVTFMLLADDGSIGGIFALPLTGGLTLDEAVRNEVEEQYAVRLHAFVNGDAGRNGVFVQEFGGNYEIDEHTRRWLPLVAARLPLVTYLCSVNRDIIGPHGRQPSKPKGLRTSKGERTFAASETRVWDVGTRIGAKLRQARAQAASSGSTGNGTAKRPHLRRAHWHHYWTGPMAGPRPLIVKWLPPIPVNFDPAEPDGPTTIREVGGGGVIAHGGPVPGPF